MTPQEKALSTVQIAKDSSAKRSTPPRKSSPFRGLFGFFSASQTPRRSKPFPSKEDSEVDNKDLSKVRPPKRASKDSTSSTSPVASATASPASVVSSSSSPNSRFGLLRAAPKPPARRSPSASPSAGDNVRSVHLSPSDNVRSAHLSPSRAPRPSRFQLPRLRGRGKGPDHDWPGDEDEHVFRESPPSLTQRLAAARQESIASQQERFTPPSFHEQIDDDDHDDDDARDSLFYSGSNPSSPERVVHVYAPNRSPQLGNRSPQLVARSNTSEISEVEDGPTEEEGRREEEVFQTNYDCHKHG